ncbi:hypothetical protein SUT328_01720 [Streptococcus parasuis]|nr:hypothetical protein SUT380_01780 [Streptococcus parasuis]GIC28711.1 hypothetical protein SUT328_01720 [Streptococcus parasuis]
MQVKKFAKWGLALTSTLVLGGVIAPVDGQLLNAPSVVYAEESQAKFDMIRVLHLDENGNDLSPMQFVKVYEGTDVAFNEAAISGYVPINAVLGDANKMTFTSVALPYTHKYVGTVLGYGSFTLSITYKPVETPVEKPLSVTFRFVDADGNTIYPDAVWSVAPGGTPAINDAPAVEGYELVDPSQAVVLVSYEQAKENDIYTIRYRKVEVLVEKPAETPAEKPAEQPVETPTEQPADQPVETPADQPVDQPADQPVEQPVDQPAEQPTEQPVDQPTEQPADQPTEQPAEQPTEQPVEQLAEQVVDTPTDKPVEQLTDASYLTDQPAGKVQVVAATDKKTVDKSAPSTPAVKPQEVSQPVTKTLPKTGDNFSMLLVLGGVLSGLSGLGLAATSRKRD